MSYDSSVGRWTAKDPISFEGGDPNLYRYAANGPTMHADPTGLLTISVGFCGEVYLGIFHIPISIEIAIGYSPGQDITVGPVITTGLQPALGLGGSVGVTGGVTGAGGVGDLGGSSTNVGTSTPIGGVEVTGSPTTTIGGSINTGPPCPVAGVHAGDLYSWAWPF